MSQADKPVRTLLLVEDSLPDAELVQDHLARSGDPHVVKHVVSLADALAAFDGDDVDVVLLDLSLPDSTGSCSIGQIREHAGEVPILVLTGMADEALTIECINAGAQDYLIKDEIAPRSLMRAVGYAIARQREGEVRELRQALERFRRLSSDGVQSGVTAQTAGLGPVRMRLPADFRNGVREYSLLLLVYVREAQADGRTPRTEMQRLVTQLGDLGVGPRDLIDVHTAALEDLSHRLTFREHNRLIVRGRLFALEMMGHLVDYYRVGHRFYES